MTLNQPKTKEAARAWVDAGKPCTYQYGFSYRGARQRPITNEEAKERIAKKCWSFGMGFYVLDWRNYEGQDVLCFNEYSENDLY